MNRRLAALFTATLFSIGARSAKACGCFTPPDPSVPVVQAGERLLFSVANGQVTAHIQIQYAGSASEFGWLLPLPSEPQLELGTDELFNQLTAQTQPKYRLQRNFGSCGQRNLFSPTAAFGKGTDESLPPSPLVIEGSIGPYNYAVLKADSKQPMLDWLEQNHYFVPVGTDDVVGPYVHTGAFFLALKLKPSAKVGDLQPVVVHYASDLPMIPIVLSSVAAQKNMGIQVWVLGQGRAIPRNYYHTVLNDAAIDWLNSGANYNDVIIRATGEAPGHHTFVTEYAGTSKVMQKLLNPEGRFGSASELAAITDPAKYVAYLLQHGFGQPAPSQPGPFVQPAQLTSQELTILQRYIPFPTALTKDVTAPQYYSQLDYWLGSYRKQNPGIFAGYDFTLDSAALTVELEERVVNPTVAAGVLFDQYPYLTRLYTTLSPEDMTRDPVFSFNRDLPEVSNLHQATLDYQCGYLNRDSSTAPAVLTTEQGFVIHLPGGVSNAKVPPVSASRRIEMLREAGPPEVVTDNSRSIVMQLGAGGCSLGQSSVRGFLWALGLIALIALRRRG